MRLSAQNFVVSVFIVGLAAGSALTAFWLSGQRSQTPMFPTPLPTPTLPATVVLAEADAHDQVIANLYQRVSPSVVNITSRQEAISRFYGIVPQEGTGSGFVYSSDGHIITNNHVIANATEVDVILANGVSPPAEILGVDPYYDLAVLHIEVPPDTLVPLELGDSSLLQVGQTVVAIGNPFGLDRTLTTGVISALERRIETDAGAVIGQAIQTDAAINPGNSGGPLLDTLGRVVGINTAINSPSGGSVGIGFAIPVNIIKRVVPALIDDGYYAHPTLGIQVAELGREVLPPDEGVQRGLLIMQVDPGGPAEQAGLRAAQINVQRGRYVFSGGDIITQVGSQPVSTRSDLLLALDEGYRPGDEVTLTLIRDGQSIRQVATLGTQR